MVAFRNDSDESIKLNLDRIRLTVRIDEDNRQQLQPLTPDRWHMRRWRKPKDPTKSRKKFHFRQARPRHSDKNWFEVQKQAENAGVHRRCGAAQHRARLLYFDLQGQFDLLNTAHLYVPDLLVMEKNRS